MTKEVRNRMMFLLGKVDEINKTTNYDANFHLDKSSLGVWINNIEPHYSAFAYSDLSEEQTYEIYMALDEIEHKKETDTTEEE